MHEPRICNPIELVEAAREAYWRGEIDEALSLQSRAFPVLRGLPGVGRWDPARLRDHVVGPLGTDLSRACAAFVLELCGPAWNWGIPGHEPHFDLFGALRLMDGECRAAFEHFIVAPWWA